MVVLALDEARTHARVRIGVHAALFHEHLIFFVWHLVNSSLESWHRAWHQHPARPLRFALWPCLQSHARGSWPTLHCVRLQTYSRF